MAQPATALPSDAPLQVIEQYLRLEYEAKGTKKSGEAETAAKQQCQKHIIEYMKTRNIPFLQVGKYYLVVKSEQKVEGWTDDLILRCFIEFHSRKFNQGTLENAALNFLNFCKEARKTGEVKDTLVSSTKRPLAASLAHALQQTRPMM